MTPGEIALTRIGPSSRASDRTSVSAAALVMATAIVPTAILVAATPEKMTNDPSGPIRGAKCLASISGPTTLVSNDCRTAPRPRGGGGRNPVAHGPEPLPEGGDGRLVGQVDELGDDPGLAGVGRGQPG